MNHRRAGDRVWVKSTERLARVMAWDAAPVSDLRYWVRFVDGGGGNAWVAASDLRAADCQCDECLRWLPRSSFNQGWSDEVLICFLCRQTHTGRVVGWSPRAERSQGIEEESALRRVVEATLE